MLEQALRLHGTVASYRQFTLRSMKDHVDEVRMLLSQNNSHWKAEATDICIHCMLLLISAGVEVDEIEALMDRRVERFQEKISEALRDKQHKAKFREGVFEDKDLDN